MAHDFTITPREDLAEAHPEARALWGIVLDRDAPGAAESAESSLRLLAEAAFGDGTEGRVVGIVVTETGDLARFEAWGVDA